MERVHFREVVKKLNKLKHDENKAKFEYLFAELRGEDEFLANMWLYETRYQLDKFRNTKVSELHYLFK